MALKGTNMRAFIIWDALREEKSRRFPDTYHNRASALAAFVRKYGLLEGETPGGLLEQYEFEIREIEISPEPVKVGL